MRPRPPAKRAEQARSNRYVAASRAAARATALLHALADVVHEARNRGIELSSSFLHFDRRHQGLVTREDLTTALIELRILPPASVTHDDEARVQQDVEECLYAISRSRARGYFTREDFVNCFARAKREIIVRVPDAADENERPTIALEDHHQQQQRVKKNKPCGLRATTESDELLSDDDAALGLETSFSLSNNGVGTLQESTALPSNTRQRRGDGARSNKKRKAKAEHADGKRALGSLLPHWAHERSKRALRELETMQRTRRGGRASWEQGHLLHTSTGPSAVVPPLHLPEEEDPMGDAQADDDTMPNEKRDGNEDEDEDGGREGAENESATPRAATTTRSHQGDDEDTRESDPMLHFPVEPDWRIHQVDEHTAISYVLLTHDTLSDSPTVSPRIPARHLHASNLDPFRGGANAHKDTAFRFTVFLDVFQRLDTLTAFLRPLLTHCPRGKVLVCGFPTAVRARTVINTEFLASAYCSLLVHLIDTTREWLVQPKLGVAAVSQSILAFGTGAHVALHLLTVTIPLGGEGTRSLVVFARAQRALVVLNGVVDPSERATRQVWTMWRQLLLEERDTADSVERHEALLNSLFSEHYLTQVASSRQHAMRQFFATRKRFFQRVSNEGGDGLALLRMLVHGQLKPREAGAVARALPNLHTISPAPFAVLVVHGTLDAVHGASQAERLAQAFSTTPPTTHADTVTDCVAPDAEAPRIHVAWLKSGHEVLQERPPFIADLLRQLILAPVHVPAVSPPEPLKPAQENSEQQLTTRDQADPKTHTNESGELNNHEQDALARVTAAVAPPTVTVQTVGAHVRRVLEERGLQWIQQELYDREREGAGPTATILARYETLLVEDAQREHRARVLEAQREARRAASGEVKQAARAEELARVAREQELQSRLLREQNAAQTKFFAQMELDREQQNRVEIDRRLMALEDARSRRCNDQFLEEEHRLSRNTAANKHVAQLQQERGEQEREAYQLELQRQRLVAQREKREALKRFQQEFEQDHFVCSAVDAYALDHAALVDAPAFAPISSGARVLAHDLAHFYELKTEQMQELQEKREAIEAARAVLTEKKRELQQQERVLLKATSTGMVAKAGMGTVRVVSVSPAEIRALARAVDEQRDAVASDQATVQTLTEQLAWSDSMLQRLSVLIKRNEGFRAEMLHKLEICYSHGSEQVLCLREDMEALMLKRDKNETALKNAKEKALRAENELARVKTKDTEFVDSTLPVAGTTQRVRRKTLVTDMETVRTNMLEMETSLAAQQEAIAQQLQEKRKWMNECASATFEVEQCRKELERVVPPPLTEQQQSAENGKTIHKRKSLTTEESDDGISLCERVRLKPHQHRSEEEKMWVRLDFLVNFAYYYKHVDASEVDLIARHPDYQLISDKKTQPKPYSEAKDSSVPSLTKEHVERLLTLPARNSLALAFLKSSEELTAHALLRKYTFGDGDEYFAKLDREFVLPTNLDGDQNPPPPTIVVTRLDELVAALERIDEPRHRAHSVLLQEAPSDSTSEEHRAAGAPLSLLSVSQQQIQPHKSVTHTFHINPRPGTSAREQAQQPESVGVLSLTISIVFQGHFKPTGYQNGRLAAVLYALPPPSASLMPASGVVAPLAIGASSTANDITLCSPHSMGKLVIRHDPTNKPVNAALTYQIVLGAPVMTTYSLEVTATHAAFPHSVLRGMRVDALKKQELLPGQKDAILNLFVTLQLSERKKRLARQMAADAQNKARRAELEMLRHTERLEQDNRQELGSDLQLDADARRELRGQIQIAEKEFTQQCFLFAQREQEVHTIEDALQELTKRHAHALQAMESMERALLLYREHLPHLAALLSTDAASTKHKGSPTKMALMTAGNVGGCCARDDAAGAKLAVELNTEYDAARSSRVRWAELAVLRAKLPSMMTPAERLRRKYKKGVDPLSKHEREWIIIDRILHPNTYEWEERLVDGGQTSSSSTATTLSRSTLGAMRRASGLDGGEASDSSGIRRKLHGPAGHNTLSKDEEKLAVLSRTEIERILKAPWNLLERKEIVVRKIVTRFREDKGKANIRSQQSDSKGGPPIPDQGASVVALLRAQPLTELTEEEREWRRLDQVLHPAFYPRSLRHVAEELTALKRLDAQQQQQSTVSRPVMQQAPLSRAELVAALDTPEEELFKLPSTTLRARNLLLKYDPRLVGNRNPFTTAAMQISSSVVVPVVETDVDERCRVVFAELQRAIANTHNEFMDSDALHTTLQRFPTKVLRLELEKELDRLLIAQITERETYELEHIHHKKGAKPGSSSMPTTKRDDSDSVSSSDSDEEAKIARERKAHDKMKADGNTRDRVRGRSLKTKTLQRQRREIKDALRGRSLEEQRRLRDEQALGVGGCMACRANPCQWKPFLHESFDTVQNRVHMLQEELERVKRSSESVLTSGVCLSAVQSNDGGAGGDHSGDPVTMRKSDLFDELTMELKRWEQNLRLRNVDSEWHATFSSKDPLFETQALHGFRQVQHTDKVQRALQREHDRLVAQLTANEVVDDILAFMLEGWIFGERESQRRVLGFVPSIKREGPLTMHDLRRLEQQRVLQLEEAARREKQAFLDGEQEMQQGVPLDKWKPIEMRAQEEAKRHKAVVKGSEMDRQLHETENALKFGIFSMTLMYFRGLSLLKQQKTVWSTSAVQQRIRDKSKEMTTTPLVTAERERMNRQARNVAVRQQRAAAVEVKAAAGAARKLKLQEKRVAAYRKRLALEHQCAKKEAHAAIEMQRLYRGHLGRRAGRKWMLRRRELDADRALAHAAAVTMQRAYRGRLGRLRAEQRRVELAEFISQMRAEEALDEEHAYWQAHRLERAARQLGAFIKKQA